MESNCGYHGDNVHVDMYLEKDHLRKEVQDDNQTTCVY